MRYRGSCHCGKIAFEVEGDIPAVMACNCSICQRKGSLLWFLPRERMRLLTPAEDMGTYLFNKHVIQHHFCKTCGIHPFAEGVAPGTNTATAAINVRCLEGVDVDALEVRHYNGRDI